MTMSRRRFLTISAAFAATPASAAPVSWHGRAFGAEVGLTIRAPRDLARAALAAARATMAEAEALFSLYDPRSALSRLNAGGRLDAPDPRFLALMRDAGAAWQMTGGMFDPTVQPLWRALAEGRDATAARAAIGWERVRYDAARIALEHGQALTFNGIAQGHATDLVTGTLARFGLTEMLVNIGEFRAAGGPWTLGLSDPAFGHLGNRRLTDGAVATSSPGAMSLGTQAHILHPELRPRWSTVSVEAATATLADALSTGLCLATRDQAAAIRNSPGVRRITLVDFGGDLTTL